MTTPALSFKLRVGFDTVDAATPAALHGLIDKSNRNREVAGLPVNLNPEIIDAAKADALVAALPGLKPETLRKLAGHSLYLNSAGLKIRVVSPTSPSSFAKPFDLVIDDVQGETVLAHVTVAIDAGLARKHALDAAHEIKAADGAVKAFEAKGDTSDAASLAKARRFAIAQTWRENAGDWAGAAPSDPAAKASLAAADAAVKAFIAPPRGSMPAPG